MDQGPANVGQCQSLGRSIHACDWLKPGARNCGLMSRGTPRSRCMSRTQKKTNNRHQSQAASACANKTIQTKGAEAPPRSSPASWFSWQKAMVLAQRLRRSYTSHRGLSLSKQMHRNCGLGRANMTPKLTESFSGRREMLGPQLARE